MQVYIRAQTNGLFRPARDLKAFSKVHLKKGESKYVQLRLISAALLLKLRTYTNAANVEVIRLKQIVFWKGSFQRKGLQYWYYTLLTKGTLDDMTNPIKN
ncbi:fibronectin type III-like domain-contianing protein [Bacillales bacterium AN1005]